MGNSQSHRFQSIQKRSEFQRLAKTGRRAYAGPVIFASFAGNENSQPRFGLTIPKYVGNAVIRNRFRRWSREFLRGKLKDGCCPQLDINIVFKRCGKGFYQQIAHSDFDKHLERLLEKIKSKNENG